MTVCVATMGNNGTLFFAADRMLTREATQTEPDAKKIYNFDGPPPVTVMWAGSSTNFGEAVGDCLVEARKNPARYEFVKDYVELYCNCFSRLIGSRAERAVLAPLGLTRQTLASNRVTNDRANALIQLIMSFDLSEEDSVEVIIAGHDSEGAHIWSVRNQHPSCHDVEGFATIGIGAEHANSQLRFAGFTRNASAGYAAILAYLAKRRAEIAPGVGRRTDLGMRGVDRLYLPFPDELIIDFDRERDAFAEAERAALATALKTTNALMFERFGGTPPEDSGAVSTEASPPSEASQLPAQQKSIDEAS